MLRAGIMAAVWNVAWPISTEYAEDSRYNTLLQVRRCLMANSFYFYF